MVGYNHHMFNRFIQDIHCGIKYRYWRFNGYVHYLVTDVGLGYSYSYGDFKSKDTRKCLRTFYMYFKGSSRSVVLKVPYGLRAAIQPRTSINDPQYVNFATNHPRRRGAARSFAVLLSQTVGGSCGLFRVTLELRGLGYKVFVPHPKKIEFKLGYSHLVVFKMPGTGLAKPLGLKSRNFVVFANDFIEVTALAARIRNLRSINVYKGKGIFKKYFRYKKKISKRK